jgi:5-methyltetrahydrofolate--homocysteine methyltransferase
MQANKGHTGTCFVEILLFLCYYVVLCIKLEIAMTIAEFTSFLSGKTAIPLDGAWGTELSRRGLPAGTLPEAWNLEAPERVAEVPRAYAVAGAEIVLTNTFGGSSYKLHKSGLDEQTAEINRAGAVISREAVGNEALVFGSIGPTGEFLEPLGLVTVDEMTAAFRVQAENLVDGGVDGIVVETMTAIEEALCGLRAAKAVAPDLPVAVTMTFDKGLQGYATMMGVTPRQAADELTTAGVDIIGTNCGNGIENMIAIVSELKVYTDKPIWARPNAGLPQLVDGKTVFPQTPEEMAAHVPALITAGAKLIGGCCGTTPDHIRAIADVCNG